MSRSWMKCKWEGIVTRKFYSSSLYNKKDVRYRSVEVHYSMNGDTKYVLNLSMHVILKFMNIFSEFLF